MKKVGKLISLIAIFSAIPKCLAEQTNIQCVHEKNWCLDGASALNSQADLKQCESADLPIKSTIFNEADKSVRFKQGPFFIGSSAGAITQIEEYGYQRLIHFRTDYYRGTSTIFLAGDDTSVLLGHSTNLVTTDGFSYLSVGGTDTCHHRPNIDDKR